MKGDIRCTRDEGKRILGILTILGSAKSIVFLISQCLCGIVILVYTGKVWVWCIHGQRVLFCPQDTDKEMFELKISKRLLLITICTCLILGLCLVSASALGAENGLEHFAVTQKPVPSFTDVQPGDWFRPYVRNVAEKGLMVGNGPTTFNPLGNVTLAETITIASRLHSIYYTGTENFQQGTVWYQVYVDYAKSVGLYLPGVTDYTRQATRAEFAQIVASAFPAEALKQINDIANGEVPDVSMGMTCSKAVYTLYRAGILTGNDNFGTFAPYSNIRRSEVAAILSRMADPETRVRFDLTEDEELLPEEENTEEPEQTPEDPKEEANDDTQQPPKVPEINGPTFLVETVTAEAGQKRVAVTVSVKNNPGIAAVALNLSHDSGLTLTEVVYNSQIPGQTMRPQTLKNPVKLIWLNPFADVEDDFVLATAYFDVSDTATKGNHQISVTYNPNDVYEMSEENVHFEIAQGSIWVTK